MRGNLVGKIVMVILAIALVANGVFLYNIYDSGENTAKEVKDLRGTLEKTHEEMGNLQGILENTQSRVAVLEVDQTNKRLQSTVVEMMDLLFEEDGKIAALQKENSNMRRDITDITATLATARANINTLAYDQYKLGENLTILGENLAKFDGKLQATRADLGSLAHGQRQLGKNLASLEDTATARDAEFRADVQYLSSELNRLGEKIFQPGAVYSKVRESVVQIQIAVDGKMVDSGSGFLFGSNTTVVTNYHVVKKAVGKEEVAVWVRYTHAEGLGLVRGKIKATRPEWDLAVIELSASLHAEPLLPATGTLSVGDQVLVIGNPGSQLGSLSTGVISGLNRTINYPTNVRYTQTDASIYYGNSGGVLLDRHGRVLGVISNGLSTSFTFGFAVPVRYVEELLKE